ncbi:MAG: hypothetical protein JO317_01110 [Verrucomicrobiae bacterium]|nr:hypothetical protein [Verrucomicrobiae bacterium]
MTLKITCWLLLLALPAFADKVPGARVRIDSRYKVVIDFNPIGATVRLPPNEYFRSDGFVEDLDAQEASILSEIGVKDFTPSDANAAENGRSMCLEFDDGKKCSYAWCKKDTNLVFATARLEHEKYHSVIALNPAGVKDIEAAMQRRGFNVKLQGMDEELAATVVELLTVHLSGVKLDELTGSELVVQAVDILRKSRQR